MNHSQYGMIPFQRGECTGVNNVARVLFEDQQYVTN